MGNGGWEPTSKVSTDSSQKVITDKAKKLNREDIMLRLIGQEHDMVANDIRYHRPCMATFKAQCLPTGISAQQNMYDIAFTRLVEMYGFLIKSLRDQYRAILHELRVKTADEYRSSTLKLRLQQHFGKRTSIICQSSGSASFVHQLYLSVMPLRSWRIWKLRYTRMRTIVHYNVQQNTQSRLQAMQVAFQRNSPSSTSSTLLHP